jgi:hypothetical protein
MTHQGIFPKFPMNTPMPPVKSFRRDGDGARSLYRACIVRALGENRWPEDHVVEMVLRAAVEPTSLVNTPELQGVLTEFVAALVPHSAAAGLFRLTTNLSFGNAARLVVPSLSDLPEADWVREGAPIPVVRGSTWGVPMSPYKIASIVPLTNEMMRSSSAEAVVREALLNKIGPSLDRSLFDDQPGVPGLRPPGIRYDVPPTTASTETSKSEAMVTDLENLIEQLTPYGGNGNIALIASPKHAVRLIMRGFTEGKAPYPMLINGTTTQSALIAIAASALVVAVDPPAIDAGGEVVLHMEDTNPQPIIDGGGAVAVPVRSTWQTDSIGLRFRLPVSWTLRAPAVAWLEPEW